MAKKNYRQIKKDTTAVSSSPAPAAVKNAPVVFNPDYSPIVRDLKRIGILAGSFIAILVILSFILN